MLDWLRRVFGRGSQARGERIAEMTTRDDAVLDHAARATKRADRMERLYADRMANRRTVRHHP